MSQEETVENYIVLLEFLLKAKQQIMAIGNEFGLSNMQTLTLVMTNPTEPHSMNNLCTTFNCDPSNITGIIDGLEQKKLVSRQAHPKDRRIKVIQLEPAGKKIRQQIMQRLTGKDSFMFANLNRTETNQFISLIQKIARPATV